MRAIHGRQSALIGEQFDHRNQVLDVLAAAPLALNGAKLHSLRDAAHKAGSR